MVQQAYEKGKRPSQLGRNQETGETRTNGYPHHIIQRGHNRQPVFVTDGAFLYYLENLR